MKRYLQYESKVIPFPVTTLNKAKPVFLLELDTVENLVFLNMILLGVLYIGSIENNI